MTRETAWTVEKNSTMFIFQNYLILIVFMYE
jgi:hypothetical protein